MHLPWQPPKKLKNLLFSLFPPHDSIAGGLELCGFNGQFTLGNCFLPGLADAAEAYEENGDHVNKNFWANSIPFHDCGNGDFLAIYTGNDCPTGTFPVAYLDHDGGEYSSVISPDFDTFLDVWERLYYVEPGLILGREFYDEQTGYINPIAKRKEDLDKFWTAACS